MTFYTYILISLSNGRYYIGCTSDLSKRLMYHNGRRNKSTRPGVPWKVVYSEEFSTKQEAYRREMQIKSYKGGGAFKRLIS